MRPTRLVAGAVLTTALALVALPGLTSSRTPSSPVPIDGAALQAIPVASDHVAAPADLDPGRRSAAFVGPDEPLVDPAGNQASTRVRPDVDQPEAAAASVAQTPRYTLRGYASFYDHGTTAMRLPRGTLVEICGDGGCIERRISDYGPSAAIVPERIADLYRPDFFSICGCPWYAGTTWVTVKVY